MFQFLPQTGKRFGLSTEDLLDVGKSADAAARYIMKNLEQFKDDPDEGGAGAAGLQSRRASHPRAI